MKRELLQIAAKVIHDSDRKRPADRVLRDVLEAERGLSAGHAAAVSHAVFAYYRWFRWLDSAKTEAQLECASALADRFASAPGTFTDSELMSRVAPDWIKSELELNAGLARALQTEPKLWLRARRGQGKALAAKLGGCVAYGPGDLSDTLEYSGEKDLFRTSEFHAGQFELQDVTSQAVGFACSPIPGETWWDVCSGEGGKLLHLSELMQNKGLIWASDRAAWRLARLKRRAARAGVFNYRAVLWDGGGRLPTKTKFDGILVDAPCSGTGTWQRNPHARWTTTPEDIQELAELQFQLLSRASVALKAGGRLVYSVCTLTRSETAGVVERMTASCPKLTRIGLKNPLDPKLSACDELWLRPECYGGNGMFISAWVLKS